MVAHITNSNPAIVTIPNDEQVTNRFLVHVNEWGMPLTYRLLQVEFGIGEWVQFKGVEGMTEINGLEVKVERGREGGGEERGREGV